MKKLKKRKNKSIFSKKMIQNITYIVIIIGVLYNIYFLVNTTIQNKEYCELFGISLFYMDTDLMEEDIEKNSLIIVHKMKDDYNYQDNDIIAYEINGKVKINKIMYSEQGKYTTKFNKSYYPDIEKTTNKEIIGKVVNHIPFLGIALKILQSKATSIIILLFLIIKLLYNKYIYLKTEERKRKKGKLKMEYEVYINSK